MFSLLLSQWKEILIRFHEQMKRQNNNPKLISSIYLTAYQPPMSYSKPKINELKNVSL